MSAELPIYDQINGHRKMWRELWWRMADGDVTRYNEIKRLDVMEFWSFFDKWRDRNNAEAERIKQQNRKR